MLLFWQNNKKNIYFLKAWALVSHSLPASKLIRSVQINSLKNQANGKLPDVTCYIQALHCSPAHFEYNFGFTYTFVSNLMIHVIQHDLRIFQKASCALRDTSPRNKNCVIFSHPHAVPNLYDFHSSVEHTFFIYSTLGSIQH